MNPTRSNNLILIHNSWSNHFEHVCGRCWRHGKQQNHHHLTPWSAIVEVIVTCFVRSELGAWCPLQNCNSTKLSVRPWRLSKKEVCKWNVRRCMSCISGSPCLNSVHENWRWKSLWELMASINQMWQWEGIPKMISQLQGWNVKVRCFIQLGRHQFYLFFLRPHILGLYHLQTALFSTLLLSAATRLPALRRTTWL